jgi:adenine-specific DNA-methyltransferase
LKTLQNSDSEVSTNTIVELETQRLALQISLDAAKSQSERNRLGQFATPPALAKEVIVAAKTLIDKSPIRFLDPGFGTGAFYSALLDTLPNDRIGASEGYEIDPHYSIPTRRTWGRHGLVLHDGDFTKTKPPASEESRFNLIICNPPYVRHHHLSGNEKERLRDACNRICGGRIDGLSGLYCYFLVLSHEWLTDAGIAVWLIPSEFMDVNYGSWIKRYLIEKVTLLRVHRFDPIEVQFNDALVSSAVVFFKKIVPKPDHEAIFSFGGTLLRPRLEKRITLAALSGERKWTHFPTGEQRTGAGYVLGDFFSIKRGLATGDNSYFILTAERAVELKLPKQFLKPILPSPRHITGDEVLADSHGDPLTRPQLYLLDCRLSEERIRESYQTLWSYLEEGKARGLAARYLCRHRRPWYAQEDRPPPPFLSTYMGRSDNASGVPFRFIRNHSKATAANVYLLMYPKNVLSTVSHVRAGLSDDVWRLLNRLKPRVLLDEGRVYGGGLHKLEPRELAHVAADEIADLLGLPKKRSAEQLQLLG